MAYVSLNWRATRTINKQRWLISKIIKIRWLLHLFDTWRRTYPIGNCGFCQKKSRTEQSKRLYLLHCFIYLRESEWNMPHFLSFRQSSGCNLVYEKQKRYTKNFLWLQCLCFPIAKQYLSRDLKKCTSLHMQLVC